MNDIIYVLSHFHELHTINNTGAGMLDHIYYMALNSGLLILHKAIYHSQTRATS